MSAYYSYKLSFAVEPMQEGLLDCERDPNIPLSDASSWWKYAPVIRLNDDQHKLVPTPQISFGSLLRAAQLDALYRASPPLSANDLNNIDAFFAEDEFQWEGEMYCVEHEWKLFALQGS